jgi:threonine synthase
MVSFVSTRNNNEKVGFKEPLLRGLAKDGGLYVPIGSPYKESLFFSSDFFETTYEILKPFIHDFDNIESILKTAFPFQPKLKKINNYLWILELFHGPSHSFKDFGVGFLASVLSAIAGRIDKRITVLTATSGDTGSAVAQAFYGKHNIDGIVLFPAGRISSIQRKQITTLGGNITALEVKGSFDDCQKMVKTAFNDSELRETLFLTSANSINIGRFLPQMVYYAYAAALLFKEQKAAPVFVVPSGNFGNLAAGLYAWKWGLPVSHFVAATNANDVIPEYLITGIFRPRTSIPTISNAMDVGNPSNFERIEYLMNSVDIPLNKLISAFTATDHETLKVIKNFFLSTGYIADPHTAVGIYAAQKYSRQKDTPLVVLGTAHPGKFPEVCEKAIGKPVKLPANLSRLQYKKEKKVTISNGYHELKEILLEQF